MCFLSRMGLEPCPSESEVEGSGPGEGLEGGDHSWTSWGGLVKLAQGSGPSRNRPLWASKGKGFLLSPGGQGSSSLCLWCCVVCVVHLVRLKTYLGLQFFVGLCAQRAP